MSSCGWKMNICSWEMDLRGPERLFQVEKSSQAWRVEGAEWLPEKLDIQQVIATREGKEDGVKFVILQGGDLFLVVVAKSYQASLVGVAFTLKEAQRILQLLLNKEET